MNRRAICWMTMGAFLAVGIIGWSFTALATETAPPAERDCLDCHRASNTTSLEGAYSNRAFCTECHAKAERSIRTVGKAQIALVVGPEVLKDYPHQQLACIRCHKDAGRSPHKTLSGAQCLDCHDRHGESPAHSPHLTVACQACHWEKGRPERDSALSQVTLAAYDASGQPMALTEHRLADAKDPALCERCHHKQNSVGAPAAVLPAKSVMCMVCHPASLTVGHFTFGAALLVFLFGVVLLFLFYYQGRVLGESGSLAHKLDLSSEYLWRLIFSRKFFTLLRVFFVDIVLQQRILKESVRRWLLHSLIFLAILFRFFLAVATGLLFYIAPGSDLALALIDKSHPFTAFVNDLLGLCIFAGIVGAAVQRLWIRPVHVKTEYQDTAALVIIGSLVLIGFVLEAARLIVTGLPPDPAGWAFIGYPLSLLLGSIQADWQAVYPVLWYLHAAVGAIFIAYLPFGKMKHVISTPLTYFMEEIAGVQR